METQSPTANRLPEQPEPTLSHRRIERFLSELRESHTAMTDVFNAGACYHLFTMLRAIEPTAEPWCGERRAHVYTRIGGRFYDINGRRRLDEAHAEPLFRRTRKPHRWRNARAKRNEGPELGPAQPRTVDIRLTWWLAVLLRYRKWTHPIRRVRYINEIKRRALDDTAWELDG